MTHRRLDSSILVAPSSARTLRVWLENEELLRPPPIVLPSLLHEGRATLLSGREKIGKTTLVAGAVSNASRGEDVLGATTREAITTLWFAIDEPVADTVRRFAALGADPDRIMINDAPRSVPDLMTALARDLTTYPIIRAVVIDTFSRVLASSGIDPNSSREVEPVVARLVDFIHGQRAGMVLLYHTGKSGREYRGSTAIGASVDDIVTLRRRGHDDEDDFEDESSDDGRRLLVQEGRNLRGRVQLACVGGVYKIFDDAHPPRDRVLEALIEHGSAGSRTELVRLAGVQKKKGLSAIAELIVEGAIVERGTGKLVPGSASSPRFPERRTAPEPASGTVRMAPSLTGSRFRNPHPTEAGTGARQSVADEEQVEVPL